MHQNMQHYSLHLLCALNEGDLSYMKGMHSYMLVDRYSTESVKIDSSFLPDLRYNLLSLDKVQ